MLTAGKYGADFILFSEPYKRAAKGKRNSYHNEALTVSIVKFGDKYKVRGYGQGPGFVWIKVEETYVYSTYISPNCSPESFRARLDEIERDMSGKKFKIVTGDMNAKHTDWGGEVTTARGEQAAQFIAANDLTILNDGKKPTLVRHNGKSYIDLTLVSPELLGGGWSWEVGEEVTLSDHEYIKFQICSRVVDRMKARRWGWGKINPKTYAARFVEHLQKNPNLAEDPKGMAEAMDRVRKNVTPRIWKNAQGYTPYWLTGEITEMRNEAQRARRVFQRSRARNRPGDENARIEYVRARKELRRQIAREKRKGWRDLCDRLEQDPYGQAYSIVVKQLSIPSPRVDMSVEEKIANFDKLFIGDRGDIIRPGERQDPPPLELQEVIEAGKRIKSGKAPGPDGIPPEGVKAAIELAPERFKRMYGECLHKNEFPEIWKKAKLLLIEKPRKADGDQVSYRPICLLNVVGKVYEGVVNGRLMKELEGGGLSGRQYGFRKGRSTIDAMKEVLKVLGPTRAARARWCAIATIDVKNAFNTAAWRRIMEALEEKGVTLYLRNIIGRYFEERTIQIERGVVRKIGGGVPQGSVLGPTLWNIMYDGVLRLEVPEGVRLVGYADDLAVAAVAESRAELVHRVNEALDTVNHWMYMNELRVAHEKTRAILLNRMRREHDLRFEMGGVEVAPSEDLLYLGLVIDWGPTFGRHIKRVVAKAGRTARALGALMPNVRGPGQAKRKILSAVVESVLLYAAPIWAGAMEVTSYRRMLKATQRKSLLRVCRAYRTVSGSALCVIAGIVPIHLMARERADKYKDKDNPEEDANRHRGITRTRWQQEWDTDRDGRWTYRIIPQIETWVNRKYGEVGYYITQCLTGHGSFEAYLNKIGKKESPECGDCERGDVGDAEHVLFKCPRWRREREEVAEKVNGEITPESICHKMCSNKENWETIGRFMTTIMTAKEGEDRR